MRGHPAGGEPARDVALDAEVDRGDREPVLALGRDRVRARGGHLGGQVGAEHLRLLPDPLQQRRRGRRRRWTRRTASRRARAGAGSAPGCRCR